MKKAKPTKKHRLAISQGILGTYYAVNEDGECRYFDYKRDAAYEFAGVTWTADPRIYPAKAGQYVKSGHMEGNPKPGARCIWVLRKGSVA